MKEALLVSEVYGLVQKWDFYQQTMGGTKAKHGDLVG